MATAKKSVVPATPKTVALSEIVSDADVLVEARNRFTRESAIEAAATPEAATAYAKDALSAFSAAEREGMRASVYAAMAAAAAVRAGLLTDGPKPKDAAEGVADPKEWGAAWITPTRPEGVSRQMVDTWIRAGEAFLGWGVDPDSSEGKRLLGGLAQSKEWNASRKVLREAIDEVRESGEVDEAEVARIATEKIAEVRATVEKAEAERKAEKEREKAAEAERVRAAVAKRTVEGVAAPEALADRITVAEQIIASLRPAIRAEREALEDLAARIAVALAQYEADLEAAKTA